MSTWNFSLSVYCRGCVSYDIDMNLGSCRRAYAFIGSEVIETNDWLGHCQCYLPNTCNPASFNSCANSSRLSLLLSMKTSLGKQLLSLEPMSASASKLRNTLLE